MPDNPAPPYLIFECETCGKKFGDFRMVEGLRTLMLAGIFIEAIHGKCERCRGDVHWKLSYEKLEILVEYIQQHRS